MIERMIAKQPAERVQSGAQLIGLLSGSVLTMDRASAPTQLLSPTEPAPIATPGGQPPGQAARASLSKAKALIRRGAA